LTLFLTPALGVPPPVFSFFPRPRCRAGPLKSKGSKDLTFPWKPLAFMRVFLVLSDASFLSPPLLDVYYFYLTSSPENKFSFLHRLFFDGVPTFSPPHPNLLRSDPSFCGWGLVITCFFSFPFLNKEYRNPFFRQHSEFIFRPRVIGESFPPSPSLQSSRDHYFPPFSSARLFGPTDPNLQEGHGLGALFGFLKFGFRLPLLSPWLTLSPLPLCVFSLSKKKLMLPLGPLSPCTVSW